jgi:hypothetical protein
MEFPHEIELSWPCLLLQIGEEEEETMEVPAGHCWVLADNGSPPQARRAMVTERPAASCERAGPVCVCR